MNLPEGFEAAYQAYGVHGIPPEAVEDWRCSVEYGAGAKQLREVNGKREVLQQIFGKMVRFSESLDDIETWLDGETPEGFAVAAGPDFSIGRRQPLTLESLDGVLEAEF